MADQTHHLRDAAIEAGRAAIAHWEMIGEPEATELVTQILDAADRVLGDIADPKPVVLWQGETKASYELSEGCDSYIAPPSFHVPPGTHVQVVAPADG